MSTPSFDDIYAEHAPAIFRYLARLTGSSPAAEDLLQEAFLRLHDHLARGEQLVSTRAWLWRVATNLARNWERDRGRRELREEVAGQGSLSRVVAFERRFEQQQLIRGALRQLPPRMRRTLLLFAEGFSYQEIAGIAGIEPGYVGVLLQRARAAFRKHYEVSDGQQAEREQRHRLR